MGRTGRVVLVTGVSRDLGRRFARAAAADPAVSRVIGVDVIPPRGDIGDVSFVRADIRNPVIAKIIAKEDVDTVVHMSVIATPGSAGGRNTMKELNVIGTMQLLAACQKAPGLENLVVKSTTTVYGASNRDPAMFTEDMEPRRLPKSGYAKDVAEVEGYVRGFARRRPDVRVTLIRAANVIGPHVHSPITSYFRLPVVPTVLGFDPRLQFLHERDLIDVLRHAVVTDVPGTFNVAGDGILMLSQALRRIQRASVSLPAFAVGGIGSALRSARVADFSPEQLSFITYGRGVDTTRMREILGFTPGVHHGRRRSPTSVSSLTPTGGRSVRALDGLTRALDADRDPRARRSRPWVTRRSSRSAPAADPGRGTGKDKPSSAARSLAGPKAARQAAGSRSRRAAKKTPAAKKAAPAAQGPAAEEGGPGRGARARGQPGRPPPRATASPLSGIPTGEWLAAFQFAAKEVFGEQWEPQLARFLAFLRRRVTGDYVVDEYGFDPEVTQRFMMTALRPIAEKWFRIEVRGAENIPAEGGALVVSNHSGTLPVDGLMTMVSIHDATGRQLRPLGADLVFRMPVVSTLARKGGATLACNEDAERMLAGGELVGVWPEGFKGIGKPYADRYKLQRFGRGGFVSAAMRTGVPIIPLSLVGAEEIYPLVGNIPSLARLLGVPYIPITPFFPLLGPLGLVPLPSKWLLEFGEPIRTDEYDAGAADDPMLVFNVTDQVRETIQQTLYSLLMKRQSVFR